MNLPKHLWLLLAGAAMIVGCSSNPQSTPATTITETDSADVTMPTATAEVSSAKDTLTFAFAGDVMMGTTYPRVQLPANDGANIFDDVAELFRNADVAAANLEGVLLDGEGDPKKCIDTLNCFTFKMPERYVKNLVDAGFDFMGIANNHSADFGASGQANTQRVLSEAGIAYAGLRGKCPYAIIERGGRKIGLTAFGHSGGTQSIMDYDEVRRIVGELDKECDVVVVCFHGGAEGSKYNHVPKQMETFLGANRGDVEKFAHTAIDAGADIVYGHGPHVTRALELYKGRIIAYSLGNFATPYGMSLNGINAHAPVLTVTTDPEGRFLSGKIHSFIQQKGVGPRRDSSNTVARNIRDLTISDFPTTPLSITPDGTITQIK